MGLKKNKSDFPVGECVKECFLKKVQYKKGVTDDDNYWEAIIFSFVNRDDWLSLFIRNPDRRKFESDVKFEHKKYQTGLAIERILSVYLDSHGMMEFKEGLSNIDRNFKAYAEHVINTLEETEYKKIKIDLKTLPNDKKDEAMILPYGVFIRKSGDLTKVLQYSEWENEIINNLYNQKH